ncbi:hypothetical protein ACFLXY_02220 [Chloroflexota bacterium]
MPRRTSDVLRVSRQALEDQGAFDGFVDIDAQFHVDPCLLKSTSIPEIQPSNSKLNKHFTEVITLLDHSPQKSGPLYRNAISLLTFPEMPNVKLGYSTAGSPGKGIGYGLAEKIADTAYEIVKAGVKDPLIFELVGLFEDDIGADRISDMTIRIIFSNILNFTQRVAHNLNVSTKKYRYKGEQYDIPYDTDSKKYITLVPYEILRNLPIALDWEDIDIVAGYNQALRNRVNDLIGYTWKQAQKRHSKRELKSAILNNPELIEDLISLYSGKTDRKYDFDKDPAGELIWADIAEEFANNFPLQLITTPEVPLNIETIVENICNQFKQLIENNGLNLLLYDDKRKPRHERFAQLLFYGIADSYCAANNLDINREPNAGNGPVDFKISSGYVRKINVEVKFTSNTSLVHGYETQLPLYNQAENTTKSIYIVIRNTQSETGLKNLYKLHEDNKKQGIDVPKIIVVDGRIKLSASKRKSE